MAVQAGHPVLLGPNCSRAMLQCCGWCSGYLYAINMQYGVTGAVSNTSTNLLMLALPAAPSMAPQIADFTVQLDQSGQTGRVGLLSQYASSKDFLVQVPCCC